MKDSLKERERALEEAFFAKYNARLLDELRKRDARRARKEALADVSGIQNEEILERLVELNIASETLAALTLVPLLEVAWADGAMDKKERAAIVKAAAKQGIVKGTPAFDLLTTWLERIPDRAILGAWKAYIGELVKDMSPEHRAQLRDQLLERAHRVAEAAGGFLGFDKVSDREKSILADLKAVF